MHASKTNRMNKSSCLGRSNAIASCHIFASRTRYACSQACSNDAITAQQVRNGPLSGRHYPAILSGACPSLWELDAAQTFRLDFFVVPHLWKPIPCPTGFSSNHAKDIRGTRCMHAPAGPVPYSTGGVKCSIWPSRSTLLDTRWTDWF